MNDSGTHHVEPEREKQSPEAGHQSTATSSTVNGLDTTEPPSREDGGAIKEGSLFEPQEPQESKEPIQRASPIEFALIVSSLVLGIFLFALDTTIVATAIPKITDEFHSLDDISWYGSAFFMTLAAFQSTWGKAYKYFSLKWSYLLSVFIFEVGSLICAVAQDSLTLIVGRAIAGVGAAGILPGAYTIIAIVAEPAKRPAYTGIMSATYGIGAVIGPLMGGALTDRASWRWCFYINLPAGGLAAAAIVFSLKAPNSATPGDVTFKEKLLQMDPLGTLLALAASICLILGLQYGGLEYTWGSSVVVGLLVGFVAISVAFVGLEIWQGERSMLTPRILRQRTVWVSSAYAFFFGGSYYIPLYYLPIYFQSVDNVSPIASGVRNIPLIILFSLGAIVSGAAITKTGVATPLLPVGAVLVTISCGLFYTLDIGSGAGEWIGYQILAGIGYGTSFQIPVIMGQATAAPSDIAPTTAIILFFQVLGGAFLISAAQSAFVNQLLHKLASTAPQVDPLLVVATGATDLHRVFPGAELDGILVAYVWGMKAAYAVAIGAVGLSVFISLFSKWSRINQGNVSGGAA